MIRTWRLFRRIYLVQDRGFCQHTSFQSHTLHSTFLTHPLVPRKLTIDQPRFRHHSEETSLIDRDMDRSTSHSDHLHASTSHIIFTFLHSTSPSRFYIYLPCHLHASAFYKTSPRPQRPRRSQSKQATKHPTRSHQQTILIQEATTHHYIQTHKTTTINNVHPTSPHLPPLPPHIHPSSLSLSRRRSLGPRM
jgi:hypothetical protein